LIPCALWMQNMCLDGWTQGVIPQVSCPYPNKNGIYFFFYSVWPYLTKGAVTTASASLKGRGYNRASATFCLCVAVLCVH
jgi:hypothetical protein